MQRRDFRVKHPRLYCPGRNPQNLSSFSDGVFLEVDELHNVASSRPQPRNGELHDPFPFTKGATLFRIGSVVPKFSLRYKSDPKSALSQQSVFHDRAAFMQLRN
jgi:hypothetical protein